MAAAVNKFKKNKKQNNLKIESVKKLTFSNISIWAIEMLATKVSKKKKKTIFWSRNSAMVKNILQEYEKKFTLTQIIKYLYDRTIHSLQW